MKTFTNKIAALEKKERDLFNSFKGVDNRNSILVSKSKKNLKSEITKNIPSPNLRPRRKFDLGIKLSKLTTTPSSTESEKSIIDNSTIGEQSTPETVVNDEVIKESNDEASIRGRNDISATDTASLEQVTPFIPTPTPPKRAGKFPFSFNGPLKPRLLKFSIEKYKKKKSPPKFSTKVKKQLSDKLKELRGLNKPEKLSNNLAGQLSESRENGNIVKDNTPKNIIDVSQDAFKETLGVKTNTKSIPLRNKFKKNRLSFGSKKNLFSKGGATKLSPFAPTKPSKILPTPRSLVKANTTPSHPEPNVDKDYQHKLQSNNKVASFLMQ